jgi:hypothetical protein
MSTMNPKKMFAASLLLACVTAATAADPFGEPVKVAVAQAEPPAPQAFAVNTADVNFRNVLNRWSKTSGWTFGAEHWTVDRDIPVIASATLTTDFKDSVRSLLAATELTDMPLKPCFYSNLVVRVVPRAQKCDRTQE